MSALIDLEGGGLRLEWPGLGALNHLSAVCVLSDGTILRGDTWTSSGENLVAACGPIELSMRAVAESGRITLGLHASAVAPAEIAGVGLTGRPEIAGTPPGWWIYNGYQSWDPADVIPLSAARRTSWWTSAVADILGRGIAAASGSAESWATRFEMREGDWLILQGPPTGAPPVIWSPQPGATIQLEPLVLSASDNAWAALREAVGPRPPRAAVPVGWLSWYHYGPWVSQDDVLENSRMLADGPFSGLGYRTVQVDDGWQQAYGDWKINSKFAGGLDRLAADLGQVDQVAGVWTAPFLVSASADLAETAPEDWFIRDPLTDERLIDPVHLSFGPMYVLDARRPAVLEHIENVFRSLYEAGIRYYKIDFLYAGAYAGVRPLRDGIRAIRRAVKDSYVLACGAPLQPLAGLAEGCRIGQDTATPIYDFDAGRPVARIFGDEVLWIARNIACRHHLDAWYQLDPDVALVGANLTLGQARQLVTAVALSGGPFFASDALPGLEPDRLALLTNPDVLGLVGGPPAVPDWEPKSEQLASIWRRGDGLVAAFNWTAGPRRLAVVKPAGGEVHDLWSGDEVDLSEGTAYLELPQSGVQLLRLKGAGRLEAWLE